MIDCVGCWRGMASERDVGHVGQSARWRWGRMNPVWVITRQCYTPLHRMKLVWLLSMFTCWPLPARPRGSPSVCLRGAIDSSFFAAAFFLRHFFVRCRSVDRIGAAAFTHRCGGDLLELLLLSFPSLHFAFLLSFSTISFPLPSS